MVRPITAILLVAVLVATSGCGVIASEKRRATNHVWSSAAPKETYETSALVLTSGLTLAFDGLIANPIRYADDAWGNAGPASSKVASPNVLGSTGAAIAKPVVFTLCFVGDELLYCTIPGWGLPD
jgi:hypothetical protein